MTWFELPLSDFEDNTLNKPLNVNSTLKNSHTLQQNFLYKQTFSPQPTVCKH